MLSAAGDWDVDAMDVGATAGLREGGGDVYDAGDLGGWPTPRALTLRVTGGAAAVATTLVDSGARFFFTQGHTRG